MEEVLRLFERFTERARKTMVLAQEEATSLGHNYIGTEHMLLGLLREESGIAAQTLRALDVTLDEVHEQIENLVGYKGEEGVDKPRPFTPRSKKVLELALREAMQLDHNYIGTEHILLGLARESEGVAARLLSNLGVDPDDVRTEVLQMLDGDPELEVVVESSAPADVAGNQMLFRGRVTSLRLSVRLEDQPQTLLVDLDYAYVVQDSHVLTEAMEHEELLDGVVAYLEGNGLGTVEAGIQGVGELILQGFPAVQEVTIGATRERALEGRAASSVTVTRTFRR